MLAKHIAITAYSVAISIIGKAKWQKVIKVEVAIAPAIPSPVDVPVSGTIISVQDEGMSTSRAIVFLGSTGIYNETLVGEFFVEQVDPLFLGVVAALVHLDLVLIAPIPRQDGCEVCRNSTRSGCSKIGHGQSVAYIKEQSADFLHFGKPVATIVSCIIKCGTRLGTGIIIVVTALVDVVPIDVVTWKAFDCLAVRGIDTQFFRRVDIIIGNGLRHGVAVSSFHRVRPLIVGNDLGCGTCHTARGSHTAITRLISHDRQVHTFRTRLIIICTRERLHGCQVGGSLTWGTCLHGRIFLRHPHVIVIHLDNVAQCIGHVIAIERTPIAIAQHIVIAIVVGHNNKTVISTQVEHIEVFGINGNGLKLLGSGSFLHVACAFHSRKSLLQECRGFLLRNLWGDIISPNALYTNQHTGY